MRANTFTVSDATSPFIYMTDYLQYVLSVQIALNGATSVLVEETLMDPNNTDNTDATYVSYTTVWLPLPASTLLGPAALTADVIGAVALQSVRALRFTVVGGTAIITVLQASGMSGM